MEAEDVIDLPASNNSGSDLMEENLRTVETVTEQVSDVFNESVETVAVDEKVSIQKETLIHSTNLDVSCILLLPFYGEGCLHKRPATMVVIYVCNCLLLRLECL